MKNFLLQILASSIGAGIAALAGFALLVLFIVAAAAGGSEPSGTIPARGVLVVDLDRPYTDRGALAGPTSLSSAILSGGHAPAALRTATDGLRRAAKDSRIAAVLLRGGSASSGWATMREISLAVADVRAAGKPVVAWAPNWDEQSWYVAAHAKPVGIATDGVFECDGLAAEVFHYAAAMKKVGVEMQVTRVGKYKSAVEPFLLESMSPENREQMLGFLGTIHATFLAEARAARSLPEGTLEAIVETKGAVPAAEAVKLGVVDSAMAYDELLDELAKHAPRVRGEVPQILLADYARLTHAGSDTAGSGGRVAVVFAEGEIVDGRDDGECGGDVVAQRLRKARLDTDTKAVVLRVNSPGGSAQASEAILREVRLLRGNKPVVVSMGDVAASGGYWVSSLADEIVAHPNTITGSIGVFGMFPNVEALARDVGVRIEVVKTGPHADATSPWRRRTPEELKLVQGFVDRIYDDFLTRVSEGRSIPVGDVAVLAEGRVWSGVQAMERRLVDAYGGLDEAIRRAASRAKLPAGHGVSYLEPEPGFLQQLTDSLGREEDEKLARVVAEIPGAGSFAQALRTVRTLRRGGVLARSPFDLAIR